MDSEAAGILTGSERILFFKLQISIQLTVEVDTNMLKRLTAVIDSSDIQIISIKMRAPGDGDQTPELH